MASLHQQSVGGQLEGDWLQESGQANGRQMGDLVKGQQLPSRNAGGRATEESSAGS